MSMNISEWPVPSMGILLMAFPDMSE